MRRQSNPLWRRLMLISLALLAFAAVLAVILLITDPEALKQVF